MTVQSARLEHGARLIVDRLRSAGFTAYWVGGCVRDRLLARPLKDIDIATSATPAQIEGLFDDVRLVGASFGVSLVRIDDQSYEIATFRKDGRYLDHRHPESVEFGTPDEDARRRDFTINALYYDPVDHHIVDFVGGRTDAENRLLRTVGEPEQRFGEDALRLLRAIRFASRLDFEIEQSTWDAIRRLAPTILVISAERVRDELTMMWLGDHPSKALRLLDESGLLALLLPEISAMKGVEQGREFHPEGDVFVHTTLCMENLSERTPVAAWAMLLHDVGKPATFERRDGRISFHQHEHVGAEMAARICERLRFSNDDTRRICDVVRRHMRFFDARNWRPATLRRFIAADTIREDLAIHRSDVLSSNSNLDSWHFVSDAVAHLSERAESAIPPPLLTGHDLIRLGFSPGPGFKAILEKVEEWQLNGEVGTPEEAAGRVVQEFGPK